MRLETKVEEFLFLDEQQLTKLQVFQRISKITTNNKQHLQFQFLTNLDKILWISRQLESSLAVIISILPIPQNGSCWMSGQIVSWLLTLSYLTANRSIRITATQINAVRNKRRRIFVLGRTTAWMPPIKRSNINAHTRPPGNPKSRSSWYWKTRKIKKVW